MTAPIVEPDGEDRRGLRIAFIGSMCLLDDASGIAHSIRSILEALARRGASATSLTASLFDANAEVVLEDRIAGESQQVETGRDGIVRVSRSGVRHHILRTASSRKGKLTRLESDRMHRACQAFLAAKQPDIVITFGSGSHARRLHDAIRASGAQLVFYLGNAEIPGSEWFQPGDRAICPSRFLSKHYGARLGAPVDVLYPIVSADRFVGDQPAAIRRRANPRELGFITHLNPVPHKGLTLLIEIARRAARERPGMKFLVLEGLMTRELLRQASVNLTSFPNVELLPVQRDMAAVYAKTAVLLMPSFWREGFGRAAVEAHLSGVPVLASRQGGLPEALGDAGSLLDIPETCVDEPLTFPDEATVSRWWVALVALWDDPVTYAAASERARQAGRRFHPDRTTAAVCRHFEEIAALGEP